MRVPCHNCGAIPKPEHNFCDACGARLRRAPAPLTSVPPTRDPRSHVPDPREIGNPDLGRVIVSILNPSPTIACLIIVGLIGLAALASPFIVSSSLVSLFDCVLAIFILMCCITFLVIFRR